VTCSIALATKVLDTKTVLAGESWTPDKFLNHTAEPADVVAWVGVGVNFAASGFQEGIK
jgi:hypothetical protein